jgi:uncharacterized protein (TIGR02145 family)
MQVFNGTAWTKTSGATASFGKPATPTSPVVTPGDMQASVAFTAPASNGGSAITGFTVTSSPGGFTATGASSPLVITGLTNGTSYTFTVVATNAVGNSDASAASVAVTPFGLPDSPTSPVATASNAQASVAFTAPASDGGSAITGYIVTSSPGGFTATGASSPLVVTGLNNGTSYTFTVVATNAAGNSVASSASVAVTPIGPPGAPTSLVATPGDMEASVAFTAPSSNGGSAITGYTVTSSPGGFTATGASSPLVVTGLPNGTSYTFNVVATNAAGNSVVSEASVAVTPIGRPGSPTSPVATPGVMQASVAFTAPASNGGFAITGYTVTSSPGGFTATGASSPLVVTGLTGGTSYTFTVVATNSAGNSVASAPSVAVTPIALPGAPTSPVATPGVWKASVAFTAPASNGGSDITGYTVTSSPGGFTATGASSPLVVTGLTNGTSYTFTVVATNAVGNSVASAASAAVTPNCYANVSGTIKVFMCYNLGVTGTQDPLSYQSGANNGSLYQWGRQTDGHEVRTSATQAGPVSAPVANKFITSAGNDWRSPSSNTLWLEASKTANDPCPAGFRVPTRAQWAGLFNNIISTDGLFPNNATQNTWTFTGNGYTVGNNLYLPLAGNRYGNNTLNVVGTYGYYWSSFGSTSTTTNASTFLISNQMVFTSFSYPKINGQSVRCISE